MHDNLRDLMEKYEERAKRVGMLPSVDNMFNITDMSYNIEIMMVSHPPKFKVPQIDLYNNSKDLVEHLETFKGHMTLHEFPREILSLAFPLILKGMTRGWFRNLQASSITSFEKICRQFLMQFMASRRRRQPTAYLLTLKQREEESLKTYLTWFNKEHLMADDKTKKNIMLVAFLGGIW